MVSEIIDRICNKTPGLNSYFAKNAAKLKRNYCLFLNRLGLLKPISFVQWLATYKCNFSCPYCEASAGAAHPDELTTNEAKGMIDDLAQMGLKRFLISGGEPLERPDILEIIEYASGAKLQLGLVTNGYRVKELWDKLRRFRYFLYFTSIDGIASYNDRVRGKESAFTQALDGIELFSGIGTKIRMVNTVVHRENISQLEELFKVLKSSGTNHWHLTPVAEVGRAAKSDSFSLRAHEIEYLMDFIRKHKKGRMTIDLGESHTYLGCFLGGAVGKPFFCGAGLTRCAIMPNGDVLGCQQVYDSSYCEGNVRNKPFSRIWKEEFKRFRQDKRLPDYCHGCLYLDGCYGGCWAQMEKQKKCLKSLWQEEVSCGRV